MAELYTVITPASTYPVTLAEAKLFSKVTTAADDALITALIIAATEQIESYTGQCFINRTIQGDFDKIFMSRNEIYPYVSLKRAPLSSVTSCQVLVDESYADESYQIKKKTHGFPRILFDDFDASLDDTPFPLRIVFVAGYGATAASVPELIKTAIKMYVNFLYRNRGDCVSKECGDLVNSMGIPAPVAGMLSSFKIIEVFA